jgi:two-component system LytT family response regulator
MFDPGRLRALIVDEDPQSRQVIREMLKGDPDVIVAECPSSRDAVEAIQTTSPHLVFLDVRLPMPDALEVLGTLNGNTVQVVILLAGNDEHVIQAFDLNAIDYLLKPLDQQRLDDALRRAKERMGKGNGGNVRQRVLSMLAGSRAVRKFPNRLIVRSGGHVIFLKTDEVDWIEAAGNYVRLHIGKEAHLLRETMSDIQGRLDPDQFIRIHRSTFVNLDKIKELQPWFHGEYVVILRDGTQLTMSRSYKSYLPELLGKSL